MGGRDVRRRRRDRQLGPGRPVIVAATGASPGGAGAGRGVRRGDRRPVAEHARTSSGRAAYRRTCGAGAGQHALPSDRARRRRRRRALPGRGDGLAAAAVRRSAVGRLGVGGPPGRLRRPQRRPLGRLRGHRHLRRDIGDALRGGAADEFDEPDGDGAPLDDEFATPCAEPEGGWQVLDPALTTDESMQTTMMRAGSSTATPSPGSTSRSIPRGTTARSGRGRGAAQRPCPAGHQRPGHRRPRGRRGGLREVWGGSLCVSTAQHTDKELRRIQDESRAPRACSRRRRAATPVERPGRLRRRDASRTGQTRRTATAWCWSSARRCRRQD